MEKEAFGHFMKPSEVLGPQVSQTVQRNGFLAQEISYLVRLFVYDFQSRFNRPFHVRSRL